MLNSQDYWRASNALLEQPGVSWMCHCSWNHQHVVSMKRLSASHAGTCVCLHIDWNNWSLLNFLILLTVREWVSVCMISTLLLLLILTHLDWCSGISSVLSRWWWCCHDQLVTLSHIMSGDNWQTCFVTTTFLTAQPRQCTAAGNRKGNQSFHSATWWWWGLWSMVWLVFVDLMTLTRFFIRYPYFQDWQQYFHHHHQNNFQPHHYSSDLHGHLDCQKMIKKS